MVGVIVVVALLVVLLAVSLGLRRYGEAQVPAGHWERTDEVFVDPTTRRRMRVWIDPVDGSRHYVPEDRT